MRQFGRRCALVAILACLAAAPARADALGDLEAKLSAAMRSAKSFVVTTSFPAQAYASTLVFVAPNRTRIAVALSATTTDVITIGQTSYSSKNGAPFERSTIAPDNETPPVPTAVKVTARHADITGAGTTYGAFLTTVPLGKVVTLTCTYDKRSYRLARCENDEVTQTYNRYDDPQNAVEAPANAIDAPKPEPTKGGR